MLTGPASKRRSSPFAAALAVFAVSAVTTGCAIHPMVEDVTSLNTNAVVFHIRCEARAAVTTAIGRYLSAQGDEYARAVGTELAAGRREFATVDLRRVSPAARGKIEHYLPAAIAYDFTFDILETNTLGGGADFVSSVTRGVFGLNLQAQSDRQRQTVRNFRVSDTFAELIGSPSYCRPGVRPEDHAYPIAGSIGLAEMVTTFVDLNEFQNLSPPKEAKDKTPVLADTFNFQTLISGSITPSVTLTPLRSGFRLTEASVTAGSSRKDIHKVIVALSLPPTATVAPASPRVLAVARPVRVPTASFRKTPAEENAVAEIDNQIQRSIVTGLAGRGIGEFR